MGVPTTLKITLETYPFQWFDERLMDPKRKVLARHFTMNGGCSLNSDWIMKNLRAPP